MTDATPLAPESLPVAPTMIDIEASGFGRDSYPIEVGYVLGDGRTYCTLIKPAPGWTHWDPAAEKTHRISRETVVRHGRDPVEVASHLNDQLHGSVVYCDGWAHDYAWLNLLFDQAGFPPAFRLDNLRSLLTEREAAFWGTLKQQVTTESRLPRHRASADARILQRTLMRLRAPLPDSPAPKPG